MKLVLQCCCLLFFAWFLSCMNVSQTSTERSDLITLKTKDGLSFTFDRKRISFSSMALKKQSFEFDPSTSGMGIHWQNPLDSTVNNPANATTKSYHYQRETGGIFKPQKPAILDITRRYKKSNIAVLERWTVYENNIHLYVEISRIQPASDEFAIEACLKIPVDFTGGKWHHHLDSSQVVVLGKTYSTLLTTGLDIGTASNSTYHRKSHLDMNLNGINHLGTDQYGLSIAMDPTRPAAYAVKYNGSQKSFDACFHLGLNPNHVQYPNRTFFGLNLLVPDEAEWGMRSAIEKYYTIYPDEFNGTLHQPKYGMVVQGGNYDGRLFSDHRDYYIDAFWQSPFYPYNISDLPDLLYYNTPSFFRDRAAKFKYFESNESPVLGKNVHDQHAEIYLDILKDYETYKFEGLRNNPFENTCTQEVFNSCSTDGSNVFIYGPVGLPKSASNFTIQPYQNVEKNYGLNLYGHYHMFIPIYRSLFRNTDGTFDSAVSSIGFVITDTTLKTALIQLNGLNPEPGIHYDHLHKPTTSPVVTENFGQLCIENVKRAVGVYGRSYMFTRINGAFENHNGVAVDVVGAYLREDYNPDMKNIASHPLGYNPNSGKVVALEHLGLAAYITALRKALPDTIAMGVNGLPISGLLFSHVDYIVAESGIRNNKKFDESYSTNKDSVFRRMNRYRMAAGDRPVTFFVRFNKTALHTDSVLQAMADIFPQYTSKGIYQNLEKVGGDVFFFSGDTTIMNTAVKNHYKAHLMMVYTLNKEGWQPIPYARTVTDKTNILIERFGKKYITVYNAGQDEQFDLRINIKKIGIKQPVVKNAETGNVISSSIAGNLLSVNDLFLESKHLLILNLE